MRQQVQQVQQVDQVGVPQQPARAQGMDAEVVVEANGVRVRPRALGALAKRSAGPVSAPWALVHHVELREPTAGRPGLLRVVVAGAPVGLPEVEDPWCVRFHRRQAPAVRAVAELVHRAAAAGPVRAPLSLPVPVVVVAVPRPRRSREERRATLLYRLSVLTLGTYLLTLLVPLLVALVVIGVIAYLVLAG